MTGIHRVRISNAKVKFDFELRRNITIVRGESGTGKTTLFDMVAEHTRLHEKSGVNISSDVPCVALTDIDWKNQLRHFRNSIVFVDEGLEEISSTDFARALRKSDNYFVLFVRENLHNLPYSVNEIYRIKTSGKFHRLDPIYKSRTGHMYGTAPKLPQAVDSTLLTEDTGSGYQFFKEAAKDSGMSCEAAGSNSSIYSWMTSHKDIPVFVIADGAAFGAEMDRVIKLQNLHPGQIQVCLPESFEWLILNSGLIRADEIDNVLSNPSDFIDSAKYFSWEQFFTDFLKQQTLNTYYSYSKNRINAFYLIPENSKKIVAAIALRING